MPRNETVTKAHIIDENRHRNHVLQAAAADRLNAAGLLRSFCRRLRGTRRVVRRDSLRIVAAGADDPRTSSQPWFGWWPRESGAAFFLAANDS